MTTCVNRRDLGLLALRLGIGAVLVAHGGQKLFGWFGGGGIEGTAQGMEAMGYRPGKPSAVASGVAEAGGGLLLALGLATPAAGAAAAGGMAGASAVHVPNGFFGQSGGFELPGFLGWTAASLGLTGAGRYSLDHATCHRLDRSWMVPAAFAVSAAAAAAVIGKRAKAMAASREPEEAALNGA
ncbi:DoxX family protein [Streptomyces sp. GMY02]|uniref:DoxX family protein n=1 Tax=Streptomyces sp. GMY02 TaxID=1333528 RepID=UPI001C2C33BA|nr:DoxX family protein [Streptomyces sp. GMY02]QXE33450.1 DoxX family protein [Streptomyces sp. GMY02]